MPPWKILTSRFLVEDRWLRLRADRCELPDGLRIEPYYVMEERDWVHVVAIDGAGDALTVRQYRHAAGVICTEWPGGVVDDGEAPLAAAMRELREETGCVAASWEALGSLFANPARQTNRVHVFLARELQIAGKQMLDDAEAIEVASCRHLTFPP
jgi:8-oxo-dGTP pyrophosphatase MutT (NUDIX family)